MRMKRFLLSLLMLVPIMSISAQGTAQKKSISKSIWNSKLPPNYTQVGSTQLYCKQTSSSIDMIGYYERDYYSSTYGDEGYKLSVKVDNYTAACVDCLNGTTSNGVTVTPTVVQQGELAKICYTVTNTNTKDVVVSLGTYADVKIGLNDMAPISRRIDTFGQTYGLTMMDGNGAQLCVLFGSGLSGVTPVSDFWFGSYLLNNTSSKMVGDYTSGKNYMEENGSYDSGMGWCWKDQTIPAGVTVEFSYLIGVGEVNLEPYSSIEVTPDDPEGWNDLNRPHRLVMEGTYESPAGLDGVIDYAVEDSEEWTALTDVLSSGDTFSAPLVAMFDPTRPVHTIRLRTRDLVGNTTQLPSVEYKDVSFCLVGGIEDKIYTGDSLFQENLTCELEIGQYVIGNYNNNILVGQASFIVEGVFPTTIGRKSYTFNILPQPLSGEIVLSATEFVYSGKAFTPDWQFSNEDYSTLKEGEDYTAEWTGNLLPGEGTLTVTGMNNYTASLSASIFIDKASLTAEMYSFVLPEKELIYDELPHGANVSVKNGVGNATITYLQEETGTETTQAPTQPGTYRIYLTIAEGTLYHGMDRTEIGSVTIQLYNTEQYALLTQIASDSKTYHMYYGTRSKLTQFLKTTSAALEASDLSAIYQAFMPMESLLEEVQASVEKYNELANYIAYAKKVQDAYGSMFTEEINAKITEKISQLQMAYNLGALTSENIDQIWPELQETMRSELTNYLTPYIDDAKAIIAQGLIEDIHNSLLQTIQEVQDLLTWSSYSIEDANYIKGILLKARNLALEAQANVQDLAILREAYTAMGGAGKLAGYWQFETAPFKLNGVTFVAGQATNITLENRNLTGALPVAFFMLTKLNTLNLSHNKLAGDIAQLFGQLTVAQQTSPLASLNISYNDFTGNIGVIPQVCTELKTLNASHNHLTECLPMLSDDMTGIDLSYQTIDWTWNFMLDDTQDNMQQLPGILRYDHQMADGLATNQRFICRQDDWTMTLNYANGEVMISAPAGQAYMGTNGALMNATLNTSSAIGSTFQINFHFMDGDANFSGTTDVLDLQSIINYIFNDWQNSSFNFTASDLYKDDGINVQDVVLMVDKLLSIGQTNNIKKYVRARVREEEVLDDTDACLFWRGNELVLNTSTCVTAADICFAGNASLTWDLQQKGFTVTEKQDADGIHAVIYSLSGAEIPVGETVIARRTSGNAGMTSAMLADRRAASVSVSLAESEATALDKLMAATDEWRFFRIDGTIAAQGMGKAQMQAARRRLATGMYILQTGNNKTQKFTIK